MRVCTDLLYHDPVLREAKFDLCLICNYVLHKCFHLLSVFIFRKLNIELIIRHVSLNIVGNNYHHA